MTLLPIHVYPKPGAAHFCLYDHGGFFFFLLDPKSNVSVIQVYINPQLKIVLKQTHNLILFE